MLRCCDDEIEKTVFYIKFLLNISERFHIWNRNTERFTNSNLKAQEKLECNREYKINYGNLFIKKITRFKLFKGNNYEQRIMDRLQ